MNYYSWGPVSAGPLISGIAAGLQPEEVPLSELFPDERDAERKANLSKLSLDNKWIATIAGNKTSIFFCVNILYCFII